MATVEIGQETATAVEWADQQFDRLTAAWGRYDIALPSENELGSRLRVAGMIAETFADARPDIGPDQWGALWVPPTAETGWPIRPTLRVPDHVSPLVPPPAWKGAGELLLTMTGRAGVALGSPRTILREGLHKIGGHEAVALGVRQYAALTLQVEAGSIDSDTSTLLLADNASCAPEVPIGQVRFNQVEFLTRRNFTDINRFRYAVKITPDMAREPNDEAFWL